MSDKPAKSILKDMKEGLSSTRKPDISHVRYPFMVYTGRQCAYGNAKYVRANFMRPVSPEGYTGTPTRADLLRFQSYLRAAASHAVQTLDAIEQYLSEYPPNVTDDVEAMKAAAYAVDVDPDPSGKVPPSFMPHVAGSCASLNMAITQAVKCGLLPADPGEPWADATCVSPTANAAREAWRRNQEAPTPTKDDDALLALKGKTVWANTGSRKHPVAIIEKHGEYVDVEWYQGDVLFTNRVHESEFDVTMAVCVPMRRPPYRTYSVPVIDGVADMRRAYDAAAAPDALVELDKEIAEGFGDGRVRNEGVDQ